MLSRLGELGINELMVEAGTRLNGALLQSNLIDALVIYMAGAVLGRDARGMFDVPELTEMSQRWDFEIVDVRRVGPDLRLSWRRKD